MPLTVNASRQPTRTTRGPSQPASTPALADWKTFKGTKLFDQLQAAYGKGPKTAEELRTAAMTCDMLGVDMKDRGLVKWFDSKAPAAVRAASLDDKVSFLAQAFASGIPAKNVSKWMPQGWGTVGGTHGPLIKNAADLDAYTRRLGSAFPGAKIVSHPLFTSIIALPKQGAPIRLTVDGQALTLGQGRLLVKASVPYGASPVALDALVKDLARQLGSLPPSR